MHFKPSHLGAGIYLLTWYVFGLTLDPDSLTRSIAPLTNYNGPVDSVLITNEGAAMVTVDSVHIRFSNGDSGDFVAGRECRPDQFFEYVYGGWVLGGLNRSLRYVKDSLFLLQDSIGNPVSFSVAKDNPFIFRVYLPVNCPYCGRLPSFPSTTEYLYLFFTASGTVDSLYVTIYNSTSVTTMVWAAGSLRNASKKSGLYTITGQKLPAGHSTTGVAVSGNRRVLMFNGRKRGTVDIP